MKKQKPQIEILEFIPGTTKARVLGRSGKTYITDYVEGACECDYMQKWTTGNRCAHLNHLLNHFAGPDWSMPDESKSPV
jgi:hypothetical protein